MDGTVVVENNTEIQTAYDEIMGVDTPCKHVSYHNRYAVGIVRKYKEIFIYNYEVSSRPLAKVKNGGQTVLLRLGFTVEQTIGVLTYIARVLREFVNQPNSAKGVQLSGVSPGAYGTPTPHIPLDDPRSIADISKTVVILNTTEFKRRCY